MADFSMCQNSSCPSAEKCRRFMAEPRELWQPYDVRKPDESGKCSDFMPVHRTATPEQLEAARKMLKIGGIGDSLRELRDK